MGNLWLILALHNTVMVLQWLVIMFASFDRFCKTNRKTQVVNSDGYGTINITLYRIFRTISCDFFFQNFRVAAYIVVQLTGGCFQKTTHYILHTAACLDHHLIKICSPTVLRNHCLCSRVATPPPPAVSLSLSVYVWCLIPVASSALQYMVAVYCTHRQSAGKLPPEVPCWARSSGPQVAVVISRSARLNASLQTLTHTRHTTDPLRAAHCGCLGLASNYCITTDFCPHFFTDLLITCMHPRTFLHARK